ncbi:hypothetical protein GC197_00140 [bacterium]|nr:hypothetical protein [bacterium]
MDDLLAFEYKRNKLIVRADVQRSESLGEVVPVADSRIAKDFRSAILVGCSKVIAVIKNLLAIVQILDSGLRGRRRRGVPNGSPSLILEWWLNAIRIHLFQKNIDKTAKISDNPFQKNTPSPDLHRQSRSLGLSNHQAEHSLKKKESRWFRSEIPG